MRTLCLLLCAAEPWQIPSCAVLVHCLCWVGCLNSGDSVSPLSSKPRVSLFFQVVRVRNIWILVPKGSIHDWCTIVGKLEDLHMQWGYGTCQVFFHSEMVMCLTQFLKISLEKTKNKNMNSAFSEFSATFPNQ